MAKIIQESVVVTFSKLVKDSEDSLSLVNSDLVLALEQVAQELTSEGVVVEVEVAK